jgi:hypothetical protein
MIVAEVLLMLIETDMLVRQHMAYLKTLERSKDELDKFDTLYDHMFYYFHCILKMTSEKAEMHAKDFYIDAMMAQ